ncbi:uncharacterized protein LOC132695766 [Cylas formicarius]|nr:uncharacterized protein LOC132695766 [Cylas formicarius]
MEATDATAVPEGTALKTLKNRKRLGYFMLLMAMFFFFLWMPDTICELIDLISEDGVSPGLLQFAQSFGLLHSGISPFLSLASMDRNWTKGVFSMCKQLHILKEHKSPSSTNEDALGPFNPKFVKPNVKVQYNRRSSSVFIY